MDEQAPVNDNQNQQPGGSRQESAIPPPAPGYGPAPSRKQSGIRRFWWVPVSCSLGCLPWLLLIAVGTGAMISSGQTETAGRHVALVRVSGTITGGGSGSDMWGGASAGSEDIVDQLERARKSSTARAIVIRINSPGGSAAGSEEIYNQIMRVRRAGKPVYASMADVAASGGYYIASACDRIYADANTITGSIGVIFSLADMSELFRKIGYRPEVLKSGKFKDIGSPARPLTPEERKLIQDMITDIYETFLKSVAEGRGVDAEKIRPVADGRMFTGRQALKLKLVDGIGGLRDAVKAAAVRGGIKGEPKVVEYRRRGIMDLLWGGLAESSASRMREEVVRRMAAEMLKTDAGFGDAR